MNTLKKNTVGNSTFFDANILLEIIDGRPRQDAARKLLRQQVDSPAISALTVHLVMYFGKKRANPIFLRKFLQDYKVLNLEASDTEWAFNNMLNNDFEDALQLATAVRNGCSHFVTFDRKLFNAYKHLPTIKLELLC